LSEEVVERVKKVIINNLGVSDDKVTENAKFIEDLGADSLIKLNLLWHLKKSLNARYQMNQLKKL